MRLLLAIPVLSLVLISGCEEGTDYVAEPGAQEDAISAQVAKTANEAADKLSAVAVEAEKSTDAVNEKLPSIIESINKIIVVLDKEVKVLEKELEKLPKQPSEGAK